jgi:hypothetical protein
MALRMNHVSSTYKGYALAAITVVVTFSYIDRCLVTLLLQPIKVDLHLSDRHIRWWVITFPNRRHVPGQ